MFIFGLSIGFAVTLIICIIIGIEMLRNKDKEVLHFRSLWIQSHKEAVEHFVNEMKLRGLLGRCYNLITFSYNYGENWQTDMGNRIKKEIKETESYLSKSPYENPNGSLKFPELHP